ncbi:hypothetical protein Chor_002085 [Crotalus horridus]
MASDEGLLINVSTLPLPRPCRPLAGQRPPNPKWGRGKKEATPVKKQRSSPVAQNKKPWKKTQTHIKGTGLPVSSLEKLSSEARAGDINKRPFVKTSSLFKNNPEIPHIQRTAVKQVQEEIFTSDSFDQLDLHPHLISTISSSLKISSMTSVQKEAIPTLLQGKDALIRSQTGSGKTLAYSIPLIQSLQKLEPKIKRSDGPYALILVPTRELVLQSFETLQKLLKVTCVILGCNVCEAFVFPSVGHLKLRKGINILVATPGRLVDHITSTQCIHFRCIRWLILDEADSLQDPACISVVSEALGSTASREKDRLREVVAVLPAQEQRGSFAMPEKLRQNVVVVPGKLRLVTLAAFLFGKFKFEKRHKMIVFFSSCEQVEFHYVLFQKVLCEESGGEGSGLAPAPPSPLTFARLHGDMKQEERSSVFQAFLQSKTGVLLCTYNPPASLAEYIHRVGRTARIGSSGNSLLILLPSEAEYVSFLASYKINIAEIKMEEILSNLMKDDRFKGNQGRYQKSQQGEVQEIHRRATVMQTEFEDFVHSSAKTLRWGKKGQEFASLTLRSRDLLRKTQVKPHLSFAFEYSSGLDPSALKGKRKKGRRKLGEQNSPS